MSTIFLTVINQLSIDDKNTNILVGNVYFLSNRYKLSSASEKITLHVSYNIIFEKHKSTVE